MAKERILELSEEEAFKLGKKCKEQGYSIYYDPYRNLDTRTNNISKLQNAWHNGWNSI